MNLSDDGLSIPADHGQVIHTDADALAVVTHVSHPDVRFGLARKESHFMQTVREPLMPMFSRGLEAMQSLVNNERVPCTIPKFWSREDVESLFCLCLKMCISDVRGPRLESTQFRQKQHEAQTMQGDNA